MNYEIKVVEKLVCKGFWFIYRLEIVMNVWFFLKVYDYFLFDKWVDFNVYGNVLGNI